MNDDNDEMTKLDPTREAQTLRGVYEAHENIEDNLLKEIQRVASSVWPEKKRERDTLGLNDPPMPATQKSPPTWIPRCEHSPPASGSSRRRRSRKTATSWNRQKI